jgi:FAD:protein FMN transferase
VGARPARADRELRSRIEPVLGTRLDVEVRSTRSRFRWVGLGRQRLGFRDFVETAALEEIDRLAGIFSVYNPSSELCRWRASAIAGSTAVVSSELAGLLELSAQWQVASGGAYNPALGTAVDIWKAAEQSARLPSVDLLDSIVDSLGTVPYELSGATIHAVGDCTGLSFNALAKGLVADRTLQVLLALRPFRGERVSAAVVNIGGDMAIDGVAVTVGIENPLRPYDNEPPLLSFEVSSGGVATSGPARRGFSIGEMAFSHIIDPRTCRPVDGGALSSTVSAETAAEADVLATVLSVTGDVTHPCIPPTARVVLVDHAGELRQRNPVTNNPVTNNPVTNNPVTNKHS